MINIKTWRDPYDTGESLIKTTHIELQPGLTVLVGCNGAGKSTLLHNIKTECKSQEIPCVLFDNLYDGGNTSILNSLLCGGPTEDGDTWGLGVTAWASSEGECIKLNVGRHARLYKEFINSGYYKDKQYRITQIFADGPESEIEDTRRVFLYDATDSGLSIDSICELKVFFNQIIEDNSNHELYLIIAANEYEMCRNEQCFDVNQGKYLKFTDYEDYRKFILNNRKHKERRLDREIKHAQKKRAKAVEKVKKLQIKLDKLKVKESEYRAQNKSLFTVRRDIDTVNHSIEDLKRTYGITEEELR